MPYGKLYVSQLRILSLLSNSKKMAIDSGNVMILFDEQMKEMHQSKVFQFKIDILTSTDFRKNLNKDGEPIPPYNEFMSSICANPGNSILINRRDPRLVDGGHEVRNSGYDKDGRNGIVNVSVRVNEADSSNEDFNTFVQAVNSVLDTELPFTSEIEIQSHEADTISNVIPPNPPEQLFTEEEDEGEEENPEDETNHATFQESE